MLHHSSFNLFLILSINSNWCSQVLCLLWKVQTSVSKLEKRKKSRPLTIYYCYREKNSEHSVLEQSILSEQENKSSGASPEKQFKFEQIIGYWKNSDGSTRHRMLFPAACIIASWWAITWNRRKSLRFDQIEFADVRHFARKYIAWALL